MMSPFSLIPLINSKPKFSATDFRMHPSNIQADCTCSSVCVCVCGRVYVCLGQVTLGMHCPFVQTCSCARSRALSLIHTDLVNSDVKAAAGQNLILLFSLKKMYISLEMS